MFVTGPDAAEETMDARVVLPDEAHQITLYEVKFRYGVDAATTDGNLSMIEVSVPPRTLVKPHMHTREDEFTLVLDGTVGARLGERRSRRSPPGAG
jgi:uncharacterized cupin superfamily protein